MKSFYLSLDSSFAIDYHIARFLFCVLLFTTHFSVINAQDWIVTEVGALPVSVSNNAVCEGFIGDTPYLFSFGGIDSTKSHSGIHLKSYKYNLLTNEVEAIPDLPDSMGKIAAGANRVDSIIYIIGGYHVFSNHTEVSSAKVHRYDIMSNTYLTDGADIPIAIDDHVQAVWRDSLIFVITGWSDNTNRPEVQIYDPANDNWVMGTSTPNNNFYKSFGASGAIVGDTIYYFGGASLSGSFNIQSAFRKGVINPDDPTNITWSLSIPDSQVKGYRMACTTVFDQLHWIGGSGVTYNYDGIAYNGSGGVSPLNRDTYIQLNEGTAWNQSFGNEFPMDLRGIASVSDTLKFLAGGMLADQMVTNKVYKLIWDNNIVETEEINEQETVVKLYPNPVKENILFVELGIEMLDELVRLEVYSSAGQLVLQKEYFAPTDILDVSLEGFATGVYLMKFRIGKSVFVEKIIRS